MAHPIDIANQAFAIYAEAHAELPNQSLVARINAQFNRAEEAEADRDELLEILHDLVMLDGEARAIGGGPGFALRSAKAWERARERFEP